MLDSLFGLTQFLVVIATLVILGALGLTSRSGRLPALPPVLVLKRFRLDEKPTDGVFVDISGRPKGLVAWLLGVLRLDDETRLQLTATSLSIRRASLQGQNLTVVPLGRVGSTLCGFRKPLGFLAIGLFFAVSGLLSLLKALLGAVTSGSNRSSSNPFGPAFSPRDDSAQAFAWAVVTLVVAALFILAYYLQRQMVIAVGDNTAQGRFGLTFKPSVIEGVTVDINRVTRATELLNRKVLEAQLRPEATASAIQVPIAAAQKAGPRPAAAPAPRCGGCGAVLEADSQFCADCGRAVEP
jgi:hypothetical protein